MYFAIGIALSIDLLRRALRSKARAGSRPGAASQDSSLVDLDQDVIDLELAYRTGDDARFTYTQGQESFRRFFESHESELEDASTAFGSKRPEERTINLEVCYSTSQDYDFLVMREDEGDVVYVTASHEEASLLHLCSSVLDLGLPFRVQGYRGRKVIDLPLVLSEEGIVQACSPLVNTSLALSISCECGGERPGPADVDVDSNTAAAAFFRLTGSIAKLIPCPCGDDTRFTAEEELDSWYEAVLEVARSLDSLHGSLPKREGFDVIATFAEVKIEYDHEQRELALELCGPATSSFPVAAELVHRMLKSYAEADEEVEAGDAGMTNAAGALSDRFCIADTAARMAWKLGVHGVQGWLCYNKLENAGPERLSVSPLNAEMRLALQYMDGAGVETLWGTPKVELEIARMPVLESDLAAIQGVPHAAGSAAGVPMIPNEKWLRGLNVRCRPRVRLESIVPSTAREVTHDYHGIQRTIAITPQGAVIAFRTREEPIRMILRGVRQISVLGSGVSFDFTELLGEHFSGDTELVNRAPPWKYGPDVFWFIFSNIMNGSIHVQRHSPAASFVPDSSKCGVGVVLRTLLDNRLWSNQTFVLSKNPKTNSWRVYWLPAKGFNYFRVLRNPDGLFKMEEVSTTTGPLVFKCAVRLDREVG